MFELRDVSVAKTLREEVASLKVERDSLKSSAAKAKRDARIAEIHDELQDLPPAPQAPSGFWVRLGLELEEYKKQALESKEKFIQRLQEQVDVADSISWSCGSVIAANYPYLRLKRWGFYVATQAPWLLPEGYLEITDTSTDRDLREGMLDLFRNIIESETRDQMRYEPESSTSHFHRAADAHTARARIRFIESLQWRLRSMEHQHEAAVVWEMYKSQGWLEEGK